MSAGGRPTAGDQDLRDSWRDLSFRARSALSWSAPAWKRPARSLERALHGAPAAAVGRAQALGRRYDLSAWPALLTQAELRENLHLLDLLDRRLLAPARGAGAGLDVGSKNGATLPALAAFFPAAWDLVEIDAHRRYWDLSTRRAHGERMARAFPGSRFIAGSVTALGGTYHMVTWILPFVRPAPLESWGLPRRLFQPATLLDHVRSRVAPGGTLFVVNQGELEREAQRALFADVGIQAECLGPLGGVFSPFVRPRFGFRWIRPGSSAG